jgi:hypothetical protein
LWLWWARSGSRRAFPRCLRIPCREASRHLAAGQVIAVAAPPVPAAAIDDFVRKVVSAGGRAEPARALAARFEGGGPDRALLAAHLAHPPATDRVPLARLQAPPRRGARLFRAH